MACARRSTEPADSVIPKVLRDSIGLRPGEVEIGVEGSGIRVDVPVEEHAGRLVIPASGITLDDEVVQVLRDAERR